MTKARKLTSPEVIKKLEERFKGKICTVSIPGYPSVSGMVDSISLEIITEPIVVLQMNDKRYTISLESILDCVKILRQ